MEDGLRGEVQYFDLPVEKVLILVLMEDGLRERQKKNYIFITDKS